MLLLAITLAVLGTHLDLPTLCGYEKIKNNRSVPTQAPVEIPDELLAQLKEITKSTGKIVTTLNDEKGKRLVAAINEGRERRGNEDSADKDKENSAYKRK